MLRKIIKIDEEKCNGCGACAAACHEGAIGMIDGKGEADARGFTATVWETVSPPARQMRFPLKSAKHLLTMKRAVKAAKSAKTHGTLPCGCPGTQSKAIRREDAVCHTGTVESQLSQWPVQIKLVPVNAPYFDGAELLIAADCTAFAYGNFHNDFIRNHITLIGCPKLDNVDYADKLAQIISANDIKSVTVVRMEVPCCGGLENAAKRALQASGKFIPWQVVTVSCDGRILK